jgi:lipid II:glycine glycyltransferase (peptidoglycan interpeptide bridge formation enzyme)
MSRRCIVWGGPLVIGENIDVGGKFLHKFKEIAQQKFIYSQFRNLFDTSNLKLVFSNLSWKYEEHLDILIDLTKTEEELWKDVNSKRRNEIRRAEREGTTFDIVSNYGQFEDTYNILREVYDRAKLPLPNYDFFEKAYKILNPEHLKIFIALNEGKIIGTMYTLCYKGVIYDWYAGSYQKFYSKYPNDLIPWKVFLWGKKNGFHTFDFGGAGKPNIPYGVRDYKKKFGGEFVNYGRYEKIHKPIFFRIAKLGFIIYQKIK